MNKRTVILIGILALLVVFLIAYGKYQTNFTQQSQSPQPAPQTPSLPDTAQTTLFLSPNPVTVSSSSATVDVVVETQTNRITAVQFNLTYDPKILTNVVVQPVAGAFFQKPIVLINKSDPASGTVTFALGIPPSETARSGSGTVARITFNTVGNVAGRQSALTFSPKTLVTAEGIEASVLKESKGTTLIFSSL